MNEQFINESENMKKSGETKTWGLTDGYAIKSNITKVGKENIGNYDMELSTEFLNSNGEVLKAFKDLGYANLGTEEENRLRQLEKQFNEEFGTDFYFMVMKQDKK